VQAANRAGLPLKLLVILSEADVEAHSPGACLGIGFHEPTARVTEARRVKQDRRGIYHAGNHDRNVVLSVCLISSSRSPMVREMKSTHRRCSS